MLYQFYLLSHDFDEIELYWVYGNKINGCCNNEKECLYLRQL